MEQISKAAVVSKIKDMIRKNELYLSQTVTDVERYQKVSAYSTLNDLLHFIDTLEVDSKEERMKEVDLEKELDFNAEVSKFIDTFYKNTKIGHKLMIRRTAKYFYELALALKAKGE